MPWAGRLFVGDGWLVYAGPVGATSAHAHHAYQLIRCLDGALALKGAADAISLPCTAAIIPPDVVHTTDAGALSVALVYVDPDTSAGRRMRRVLTKTTGAAAWQEAGEALRRVSLGVLPQTWAEARAVNERFVEQVVGAQARTLPMHPAVLRARAWLAEHFTDEDVSLDRVGREAGLSGDRLSHLFNEQLGLGLRPFILWLRLQRAAKELARGESVTRSAVAAGFADGAHLTRTFRRMFGLAPTQLVGLVEWVLPDVEA